METRVKITKCDNKDSIGLEGTLYTNLACFHANAGILPMIEILQIDKKETCIGIISDNKVFCWTKKDNWNVEIIRV